MLIPTVLLDLKNKKNGDRLTLTYQGLCLDVWVDRRSEAEKVLVAYLNQGK